MQSQRPLDVLFLTSFSDYCYRAIPALAQMADTLDVRFTFLHSYNPKTQRHADAEKSLRSFFPEADQYEGCERLVRPGRLIDSVRRLAQTRAVDLIVAPASDPLGLPRFGHRSIRGQLLRDVPVPIWTMGRHTRREKLIRPTRNVACWMDFHSDYTAHLAFALEYAVKLDATLHLLQAVPEIHEGSLIPWVHGDKPMHPRAIEQELLKIVGRTSCAPEVHVTTGTGRSALVKLLTQCDADVLFTEQDQSMLADWLEWNVADRCPCPVVCLGKHAALRPWSLERGGAVRPLPAGALLEGVLEYDLDRVNSL